MFPRIAYLFCLVMFSGPYLAIDHRRPIGASGTTQFLCNLMSVLLVGFPGCPTLHQ